VKETKNNIKKVVNSVPKDAKSQKVFMEVSSEPEIYTAGKNTFFDDMLNIWIFLNNCFFANFLPTI
jgi:iron complex transport system substrate-binding protein